MRQATEAIAYGIGVVGLLNVQYALKDDVLYVLEANPRASRTVPFVSKATAVPLAKACARIMLGATIAQLREEGVLARTGDGGTTPRNAPVAVKEAVLPFNRFRKADGTQIDSLLGPEMKSTGEVMGIDRDFGTAFAKSQTAAYGSLPAAGHGVRLGGQPGQALAGLPGQAPRRSRLPRPGHRGHGGDVAAQRDSLRRSAQALRRAQRGPAGPSAVDAIRAGEVDMVINTPYGNSGPRIDGYEIRSAAVSMNIPCVTTVQGASAAVQGIEAGIRGDIGVMSLQELHSALGSASVGGFGDRLAERHGERGPLCLGIDPHPELLRAWGLPIDADGLAAVLRHLCVRVRGLRRRQTAGGVLRGVTAPRDTRCSSGRSPRCVTPACWCLPTPSGATSARRWPPTRRPGPATRRWRATR